MDQKLMGYVNRSVSNHIAYIEFMHPAHNSLPRNLLDQLVKEIEIAGNDDTVAVILLKSAGERTFCAGASFAELTSIQNKTEGKDFFLGFANVINAIRKCPKLIIGRVQGKAVGGGVGIASAVDYCMATKYASIKLSELALGLGPFVIGPAVQRKIGVAAFSNLAINATEWQTAKWAKQKGLFQEVFETTKQLDDYLSVFLARLSKMNPEALHLLKNIFWEGTENWEIILEKRAEISGNLVNSSFTKQALESFTKKA